MMQILASENIEDAEAGEKFHRHAHTEIAIYGYGDLRILRELLCFSQSWLVIFVAPKRVLASESLEEA